jgi:hypothetical protein
MREAERLYQSACAVVRHEFQSDVELHPHFTVVIGTERDELNCTRTERGEIRMKKWDPIKFTQRNVILAFEQMLTPDAIVQLGNRVIRQYNPRWTSRTSVSPRPRRRNFILATMAPNGAFVASNLWRLRSRQS